jgi:outer membrane immunogenic protein
MKRIVAVVAFVAACSWAMPASSADIFYKAPVQKKYNWTGWYAGVDVGYFDGETVNTPRTPGIFPNADLSGALVSLNVGYRWHMPSDWVYALQLNVPVYAKDQSPVVPVVGLQTGELNWAFYGTGQIGKAYGRWLPYFEAGLGAGNADGANPAGPVSTTNTHLIYTVGVGINYALTDRLTTGLKYQYLGSSKELYQSIGSAADFGLRLNIFSLTVGYRF